MGPDAPATQQAEPRQASEDAGARARGRGLGGGPRTFLEESLSSASSKACSPAPFLASFF